MKIIEKIRQKEENLRSVRQPTIAFLGDSVTHGCFDVYVKDGVLKTTMEMGNGYHEKVKRILNILYPEAPVNIINAGISGDTAQGGLERLDRDVLSYNPDLIVVCYGLNDANGEQKGIDAYGQDLRSIFQKAADEGMEVIFLTPNLRTEKCDRNVGEKLIEDAWKVNAENERNGWLARYLDVARTVCAEMDVPLCDCNALWQKLKENGVEINEILSNKINHPTKELNWMFAYELVKTMFMN